MHHNDFETLSNEKVSIALLHSNGSNDCLTSKYSKESKDHDAALKTASNGTPNLWHPSYIGILINYGCVGFISGTFPRTLYPFFRMYLNMDGYQVAAAKSLIDLAWSFKIFIGILSDSVPLFGYKRRSYIVIGWTICLLFLIKLITEPMGLPYYKKGDILLFENNATLRHVLNPKAADNGTKFIVLMMLASLGYVIADVACDAVMVEIAMTESEQIRGHTQTMVYFIRFFISSIASGIVGFCLNGEEYGGTFTWSISFNTLMVIVAVVVSIALPAAFCIPDHAVTPNEVLPIRKKLQEMWNICKQQAIWQLMAFNFCNSFFFDFEAAPSTIVQSDWAKVEPINDSLFSILSNLLLCSGIYLTKVYFLQCSWRKLCLYTTVIYVCIDAIVSFCTIFDVYRDQWFYLGAPVIGNIPHGIRYIVTSFVIIEIADVGHEGATYGLLTTIGNLASPFAISISKCIDSNFRAYQSDIDSDTAYVRRQVAYTFLIMYAMKLLSNVTLVLLPRQKAEARELKRNGKTSSLAAVIAIVVAIAALVYGIITNLLSVFPSTSCLIIAGGDGCK